MIEHPDSEVQAARVVAEAARTGATIAIMGGGTRGVNQINAGITLHTARLSGVTLYEPSEMVISARAGTPLETVQAALADQGQMLPFDPMDHRQVAGTSGTPTIGAVAACNISGPCRPTAGAARDHLIGIRMINGSGEIIKSGGRVMKNVTGLDLVKLNAGAFGALGLLTEVTFKVLPVPEARLTLCLEELAPYRALEAMTEAMATPYVVSSAAYMPEADNGSPSRTVLRLEGFAESCRYRFGQLAQRLSVYGSAHKIEDDEERTLWRDLRDARLLAEFPHILRVHIAPSRAGQIVALAVHEGLRFTIDWAGGLIWLGLPQDAAPEETMKRIGELGGHPSCVRTTSAAPDTLPPSPGVQVLSRRIKHAFDPKAIFNPGVLAGHI